MRYTRIAAAKKFFPHTMWLVLEWSIWDELLLSSSRSKPARQYSWISCSRPWWTRCRGKAPSWGWRVEDFLGWTSRNSNCSLPGHFDSKFGSCMTDLACPRGRCGTRRSSPSSASTCSDRRRSSSTKPPRRFSVPKLHVLQVHWPLDDAASRVLQALLGPGRSQSRSQDACRIIEKMSTIPFIRAKMFSLNPESPWVPCMFAYSS